MGYKDPPRHRWFKKGQSGNPKGRPKKAEPIFSGPQAANALVLREAQKDISVREGDEIRKISSIRAVILAQKKSALSGRAYAQRDFVARYEQAERERRLKIEEECRWWTSYIEHRRDLEKRCSAAGVPSPIVYPHLDDIQINWETGVQFVGPFDEEEQQALLKRIEIRDTWLLQSVLEWRTAAPGIKPGDEPCLSYTMFFLFNRSFPERYRLSDPQVASRVVAHNSISKRDLLKQVHQKWHSLGYEVRRGKIFPDRKDTERIFEAIAKAFEEPN